MLTTNEDIIIRFLLGELPENTRQELEERLFQDDSFYQQVLAMQEELVDDYVQDQLPADRHKQFESYFLASPRRKARVDFAVAFSRALTGRAAQPITTTPPPSWWQAFLAFSRPRLAFAALAAALVALIGASWLVFENRRLSGGIEQARQERETLIRQNRTDDAETQLRIEELEREIGSLRSQGGELETKIKQKERELETLQRTRTPARSGSTGGEIAAFILPPGLTRGSDEPEKLIIPAGVRSVRLQLDLERDENYQSYVAEIRTARGNLVWSKSGLVGQKTSYGGAVFLTIPAGLVSSGEFEVSLKGAANGRVEAVGYYYFLALKR